MSDTFTATLGGLAALTGWGVSDYLAAKNSKKFSGFEVNAAIQIPGFIILSFILLLDHQDMPSLSHIATIVLTGLCFTAAYLFFIKAFSIGAVGVVAPIANAFPLITLVLSVAFLSDTFTDLQILSMVIIVCGAILLAHEKRKKGQPFYILQKEVLYALGATGMWGIGFFIINSVVSKEPWQIVTGILSITMGIVAVAMLLIAERNNVRKAIRKVPANHLGLISGTILTSGTIVFYYAGQRTGSILIPAVIGAAGPLVTSIIAAVIDKEQIDKIRRIGAVAVVAGIILLNLA